MRDAGRFSERGLCAARVYGSILVASMAILVGLSGCASMVGYGVGRVIDQSAPRGIPPPACGKHPLRQGQRVTLRLEDGTKRTGLYLWHDCAGESLLVMKTEVSSYDLPGTHSDTLRVPLQSIRQIDVPRQAARYVGLVIGAGVDFLVWGMVLTSVQGGWGLE